MQLNRLDVHDKLIDLKIEHERITRGVQECILNRYEEFELHPFYIFSHKRELGHDERLGLFHNEFKKELTQIGYRSLFPKLDDVPKFRYLWQARLTKPNPQPNSLAIRVTPPSDVVEVLWNIPEQALWEEYEEGKMFHNEFILKNIYEFKNNPKNLCKINPNDLSDDKVREIYRKISKNPKYAKNKISALG